MVSVPAQLTKDTVEQKNQEIDDLTEMMMRCLENADVEDFIGKFVRIRLCLILYSSSMIHIMQSFILFIVILQFELFIYLCLF